MSHQTAFIITSLTTPFPAQPTDQQLQQAAQEAGNLAVAAANAMDHRSGDNPAPETLAIGCSQYRFIQGNLDTNHDTFAGTPGSGGPS